MINMITRSGDYKYDIEEVDNIIKKMKKQIELMAKEINAKTLKKEQWCPLISKGKGCYDNDTCLECLKKYFEEKAEESKC